MVYSHLRHLKPKKHPKKLSPVSQVPRCMMFRPIVSLHRLQLRKEPTRVSYRQMCPLDGFVSPTCLIIVKLRTRNALLIPERVKCCPLRMAQPIAVMSSLENSRARQGNSRLKSQNLILKMLLMHRPARCMKQLPQAI